MRNHYQPSDTENVPENVEKAYATLSQLRKERTNH
jgi:hypothetical protein